MPSIINASTSTGLVTTADTSGVLQLQTGGTSAVTVDASQQVGIGTASPASKLDVSGGSLRINEDGAGTKIITMRSNYASLGPAINVTTNDPLLFLTNNTERMRVNAGAPILCLSGGSTTATGTGIAFPATQSASSDANTLDDYEEGTWTPTDASGAGLSFTIYSATYVKVGKLVFLNVYLTYPTTASGSAATIGGLPFAAQTTGYSYLSGRALNNLGYAASWQVNQALSTMTANPAWNSSGSFTNANFTGSFVLISGCYISA